MTFTPEETEAGRADQDDILGEDEPVNVFLDVPAALPKSPAAAVISALQWLGLFALSAGTAMLAAWLSAAT